MVVRFELLGDEMPFCEVVTKGNEVDVEVLVARLVHDDVPGLLCAYTIVRDNIGMTKRGQNLPANARSAGAPSAHIAETPTLGFLGFSAIALTTSYSARPPCSTD